MASSNSDGGERPVGQADGRSVVRIGWLEARHGFPVGPVPPEFVAALRDLCFDHRTEVTRGIHPCDLGACVGRPLWPPIVIERDGQVVHLGSAQIWVTRDEASYFAAPDLIYHYVADHQYSPPRHFIDAVLRNALSTDRMEEE